MISRPGAGITIPTMFDMSDWALTEAWGLAGLFLASFLAATLLPGGSEAALFAAVRAYPDQVSTAWALATLGNTLGGMSTYLAGRLMKQYTLPERTHPLLRYGSGALLLSWAPVIGDALCLAAGWLRLPWVACLVWMCVGKAARYIAVIGVERLV